VRFTSAEFHDGDGIGCSVKLCVRNVFDKAATPRGAVDQAGRWAAPGSGPPDTADDGRVVEGEVAVHQRRHLRARVHMQEVRPIAVAVEGSDPLEGHPLLVERDPYLPPRRG